MLSSAEKRILAQHQLHGSLIRWIYRILAPRHPRGWLDFHALIDDARPNTLSSIHCHGMERWKLPNIEIVDVPADLGGFAHGIMFDITGYMKSHKAIKPGETFGGLLVSDEQIVPHQCSLHLACIEDEPDTRGFLRIVDVHESVDAGFPKKLFAAHLLAIASKTRNTGKREWILRRSTEIFPGEPNTGPEDEQAARDNPGNFFSWSDLGDLLCDRGRTEEGLKCLKVASEHWPFGARRNGRMILKAISEGRLPPQESDPRSRFWAEFMKTQADGQ